MKHSILAGTLAGLIGLASTPLFCAYAQSPAPSARKPSRSQSQATPQQPPYLKQQTGSLDTTVSNPEADQDSEGEEGKTEAEEQKLYSYPAAKASPKATPSVQSPESNRIGDLSDDFGMTLSKELNRSSAGCTVSTTDSLLEKTCPGIANFYHFYQYIKLGGGPSDSTLEKQVGEYTRLLALEFLLPIGRLFRPYHFLNTGKSVPESEFKAVEANLPQAKENAQKGVAAAFDHYFHRSEVGQYLTSPDFKRFQESGKSKDFIKLHNFK